jgi:transposase
MLIIGADYHPSFQQIAFFIEETGEYGEQRLRHDDGGAERFYRDLNQRGISVRVGMEATVYSRWFERLLAELGFEVWIGDPAEIRTRRAKKQKTDSQLDPIRSKMTNPFRISLWAGCVKRSDARAR